MAWHKLWLRVYIWSKAWGGGGVPSRMTWAFETSEPTMLAPLLQQDHIPNASQSGLDQLRSKHSEISRFRGHSFSFKPQQSINLKNHILIRKLSKIKDVEIEEWSIFCALEILRFPFFIFVRYPISHWLLLSLCSSVNVHYLSNILYLSKLYLNKLCVYVCIHIYDLI